MSEFIFSSMFVLLAGCHGMTSKKEWRKGVNYPRIRETRMHFQLYKWVFAHNGVHSVKEEVDDCLLSAREFTLSE